MFPSHCVFRLEKLLYNKKNCELYHGRRLDPNPTEQLQQNLIFDFGGEQVSDRVTSPHHPGWPDNPDADNVAVKRVKFAAETAMLEWAKNKEQLREIMKLSSPNVVTHYFALKKEASLVTPSCCEIFMEYCPEDNLQNHLVCLLKNNAPIPLSNYGYQILSGLQHIHDSGLIHGDIKAANILVLNKQGITCLKIGDFGEVIKLQGESTRTRDVPDVVGTVRFLSPEMIALEILDGSHRRVGRLTDIWSFGCVLLQLVANDINAPRYVSETGPNETKIYFDPLGCGSAHRALAKLWTIVKDNKFPEIEHDPKIVIEQFHGSLFGIPVGLKTEWESLQGVSAISNGQSANAWKEYAQVVGLCFRTSPNSMAYEDSSRCDTYPANHQLRPCAKHFKTDPIFNLNGTRTDQTHTGVVYGQNVQL